MLYDANLNDSWLLQVCFPDHFEPKTNTKKAAAFFDVSESTVNKWLRNDEMPPLARRLCLTIRNGNLMLHGDDWAGFSVRGDRLITPWQGHELKPAHLLGTFFLKQRGDLPHWWHSIESDWQSAVLDFPSDHEQDGEAQHQYRFIQY